MASGWAHDSAVQEQIDASIDDAVQLAKSQLPRGDGLNHCEECDAVIPGARRKAVPGVRLCINCQALSEQNRRTPSAFNRRGSKDSQLR